ncbi:MAG: YihY/virulence factor BrkB family protein, partial [Bacteroidetes bacterium]|nr:YihY/virulence factor BrkB family protein [Bacteroidota bacterium]
LIPYIPVHEMHTQVMEFMQTLMPSNAFITIQGTLQDILETPRGSLLSFGLILALYFGSNGIFAMTETFNPNDKHNYFYRRFMGIVLALVLGTLFIVDITVLLLGETGIKYILDFLNLNGQIADWAILLLRWGMMLLLIFVAYAILYYYGDPLREKWKYIYPGAFLATLFTLLTSFGYGYYVGRWGNYNKLYGSIGALIITMLWMYFNSIVVICGHEFNQSLRRDVRAV